MVHDTIIIAVSCAVALLQIWVLIRTIITWRATDHACFVDEMRKARREKRRIIGWTKAGQPVFEAPGTAFVGPDAAPGSWM